MNILDQIKAEIERLKVDYLNRSYTFIPTAMQQLLDFIDTLKEQPVDLDNKTIMEEIRKLGCYPSEFDVARRFYALGKQSKEQPVCEELETEALRSAGVLLSEHFEDEDDDAIRTTALRCWNGGVIHGASWQKEQMMKEAVEGEVVKDINNKLAVTAKNVNLDGFKFGEKVRIIIVKEDKK